MSGKSPVALPRLPSVSELLEKPPVKDLLRQLGRGTVATGARSYLRQLRGELHDRFAASSLPTPGELAERAARYILGSYQQRNPTVINATGWLLGDQWATVPLATSAQNALVAMASGFSLRDTSETSTLATTAEMLCTPTAAESAAVLHSYEGALWLALSTLAAERGVVVARGQLGLLENGSLADLIVNGGAQLQAVGATNAARAADYERAITETTALVLVSRSDDYHVAGHSEWVHREELVSLCRDRELPLLEALDAGGLDGGLPAVGDECDVASAAASLAAGVDLVILRGDGLLGGPPCGILLGRRDLIQQIRQHPLFAAWQIDALRLAALAETIRANQRSDQPARHAVPLRELLETSVENLQHRAGRLAQQLANVDGILSAEAIPLAGSIAASESPASRLASFGVALTPRDGEMETLVERLRTAPLPVVGRVDQDRLILDLRCVLPDQDRQIVAGVASDPESMPGDAPMSESDQGDPSGWGEAV